MMASSPNSTMFLPCQFCSTPILFPIHPNSSFVQIVSPCLAKVLLPIGPFLLSLFSICFLSIHSLIFHPNGHPLHFSKLAISKLLISGFDLFISIVDLCLSLFIPSFFFLGPSPILPEQYNSSILAFSFSFCTFLAYGQSFRSGFITSGSLHLAWLFRLFCLFPDFLLYFFSSSPFIPSNLIIFLHIFLALAISILLCAADSPSSQYQRLEEIPAGKEECPEIRSSAISCLTFCYASKMVWLGLRGTINFDQLWALDKENQAEFLRDRFYRTAKSKEQNSAINLRLFFWHIFLCVWEWNLSASFLAIFIVLGRYANASFLRIIVDSVNAQNPLWLSIFALCCLFIVDFASKLLTARRDFHSFRVFLNVRSVLTTIIFDKMLRLSAFGRSKYSAGEIINLLTTDVMRIRFVYWELCDFIYCPFMVLVAFLGLFLEIGWNTLYGLCILLSVLPLNYALSKWNTNYEQKQMKIKDARLKLMNDVLSGVKVLKLYAWEESMQRQIFELRKKEMKTLRKIFFLDVAITVSFQLAPLIATLVSFFGYTILQGHPMRPDVTFVSLLFFAMLRFSIYQIPQLLTNAIKAWVSAKRVLAFLNESEQQPSHIVRHSPAHSHPIVFLRHCSFSWTSTNLVANPNLHLRDISLEVGRGELIGIVGRVGAGKSSLLAAILGEMERMGGEQDEAIVFAHKIGYVPQQPWIQNQTLRANILFDSPFEEEKYGKVLKCCALEEDLKLLAAGDLTEIGEKGINLSGGQKARVALARAVYMDADLYILDDTLSAVDAHVGTHIFERVIGNKGLLAGKTRLWALNSLSFLRYCDRIVVMNDGKIHGIGTLEQLKQQKEGPFADLIQEFMQKHLERQKSAKSGSGMNVKAKNDELADVLDQISGSPLSHSLLEHFRGEGELQPNLSRSLPTSQDALEKQFLPSSTNIRPRYHFRHSSHSQSSQHSQDHWHENSQNQIETELIGKLTEEEQLAIGMVSRRVYLDYMRAFGIWLSIGFFVFLFIGSSTFEALSNVWLAKWSSMGANGTEVDSAWNLAIYGGFNGVYVFCTAASGIIIAIGAYHASSTFHDQLVHSLFRSPMAFFDRTPLGRILNRLSNDIDRIDENIPWAISIAMTVFAEALNSLISICVVIPLLMLVILPLLAIFLFIVHFYNVASVQLRRLTSKSWSTTVSIVQDAYLGADSIRVFNVKKKFREKCCQLIDFTNESFAVEIFTNRWLQIRLDLISDLAVFICVLVAILLANKGIITLGALAMVIGCGYTFTGYLGEIARVWRESEVQMVCIERVSEYIRNEHEPKWRMPNSRMENWPSKGQIQFRDVCLRYRPGMDLVLKEVTFEVESGEKVGIVGRTGAGKSSLTLALFRIVEPCSGYILIDGVDICSIGLHDLREALTIIPQDPVLFCGKLRTNLDPFKENADECIWEALEKAHLKETICRFDGGLDYEIGEGGSNLSVGQRQLVCLARAILRKRTRILVLDEATAAIDSETDSRIQQSIRTHFKHCTILTIAHRLDTILDYDRILVMDAGKVAEFDSPTNLLANSQSLFFQLAIQAGIILNRE